MTVSKILGYSSIQMAMRDAHPTPENMKFAVEKLGKFLNIDSGMVYAPRRNSIRCRAQSIL